MAKEACHISEGRDKVELQIGTSVVIHSLSSAAGQELNGCQGELLGFDDASKRYMVRIPQHGNKKLKSDNLSVVSVASPFATSIPAGCGKSDWKNRENQGNANGYNLSTSSSSSSAKMLGAMSEMHDPCWGGPMVQRERYADRLQRILQVPLRGDSYAERFAKARELFRLGWCLYLEQEWVTSSVALVEALLVEEKAMPQALAEVNVAGGPETCPFGRVVGTLQSERCRDAADYDLRVAFLRVHWFDMQMLLARRLVEQSQDNFEAAQEHQNRWFDLLCSMDDLARRTIAVFSNKEASDPRVLSRLTLVQAQYGENPPLSRSSIDCSKLAAQAVSLWPEDPIARIWCAREEDHEVLLRILEPDAPQREKLKVIVKSKTTTQQPAVDEIDLEGFGFDIAGGDYVVLDGDHTDKSYDEVVKS